MHGGVTIGKACMRNWVGKSLYQRRWYRRLCNYFKLKNSHNPEYLYAEIPPERQVMYNLRTARLYEQNIGRTVRFSNSYFENTFLNGTRSVHFLVHCPLFELQRTDLLGQLGDLLGIDIDSLDSTTICELLLVGRPNANVIVNRIILEATISFIKSTQRLV